MSPNVAKTMDYTCTFVVIAKKFKQSWSKHSRIIWKFSQTKTQISRRRNCLQSYHSCYIHRDELTFTSLKQKWWKLFWNCTCWQSTDVDPWYTCSSTFFGSGSVILLRPKIDLAPQKHDVISMPRQQYTNTKHIPIESYHPVVSIMLRHMDQKKIFGLNLCCREVKINKILGGDLPYFSLKCDNLP